MLLHELIEKQAAERGDALALVCGQERVTFAELAERIRALADALMALTEPDDRVVLLSENSIDMVVALYAVPAAGAIASLANTRHTAAELAQLVDSTSPVLLLASGAQLERLDKDATAEVLGCRVERLEGFANRNGTAHARNISDSGHTGAQPTRQRRMSDVAWLIHTSGSTGRPKGVRLTHASLLAAIEVGAAARPFTDDDVYLFPFPLFHVAAYHVVHVHRRGRPVVLVPGFDADEILRLVPAEGVTTCSLAPTMLAMLLERPGAVDALASLRQIAYGASAMPLDLLRRVQELLPDCDLGQGYGMTETSGNAVFLSAQDHRLAATSRPELLRAAGRPGPGVEIRLADDDGVEVPRGEVGEILVRGAQVCDGYWNDPEATARSRHGEWLRTGDLGRLDAEGYLYVVDRSKDIIVSGGENVSSREVEDLLSQHPSVRSVAVIATPHERWGEAVTAVVVETSPGELGGTALMEWTKGRIAGFKRPRRVELVDELPVNAAGKIDKPALRQRFG